MYVIVKLIWKCATFKDFILFLKHIYAFFLLLFHCPYTPLKHMHFYLLKGLWTDFIILYFDVHL